jgi:hypothetical protein
MTTRGGAQARRQDVTSRMLGAFGDDPLSRREARR